MRLTPLLQIEDILIRRLTPAGSGEYEATQFPSASKPRNLIREVAVNSAMPWKDAFNKLPPAAKADTDSELAFDWDDPNDPGRVLYECAEDMKKLWNHRTIQELLDKQNLRLEEMAGL